ncbi:hypothetical protein, partial [Pseudomonas cannabina]
ISDSLDFGAGPLRLRSDSVHYTALIASNPVHYPAFRVLYPADPVHYPAFRVLYTCTISRKPLAQKGFSHIQNPKAFESDKAK